jgi:dihydroxyacetone kinase
MIKLELSIDEVNLIMNGLGNMSYAHVSALVDSIRTQVAPQLEQPKPADPE